MGQGEGGNGDRNGSWFRTKRKKRLEEALDDAVRHDDRTTVGPRLARSGPARPADGRFRD